MIGLIDTGCHADIIACILSIEEAGGACEQPGG
jgi:hypothetical protein